MPRWAASARWIPEQIDRAQLRSTLTYRVLPRLRLGIEYNPQVDEDGPLLNWVAVTENKTRPAVIFGTSSDRIGTPDGQAYFVTISKDLGSMTNTRLPLAPYAGAAFGTYEDRWQIIGGLRARLPRGFALSVLWDGVELHSGLEYSTSTFRGAAKSGADRKKIDHTFTLLWVQTEQLGLAYSAGF